MLITKEQTEQIIFWWNIFKEKIGMDNPGAIEIAADSFFFGAVAQMLQMPTDKLTVADFPPAVAMCLMAMRPIYTVYEGKDHPKFILRSQMSEDSPGTEPHCIVLRDISSEVGQRFVVHLYTPRNGGFHNGTYVNDPTEVMQAYLDRCIRAGLAPF